MIFVMCILRVGFLMFFVIEKFEIIVVILVILRVVVFVVFVG